MNKIVDNCWFLTGPTASGKTPLGFELAEQLGAEIISLDSMAVYRDMDIGTAKPNMEYRQRISHHLLDLTSPQDDFSLAQYLEYAYQAIKEIQARDRQVLFVGGTPLYLKCLLRGVDSGPPPDWKFREEVQRELHTTGSQALHHRLHQVDPLAAAKLHPNDTRRIIRALEVYKNTGQPLSHRQLHFEDPPVEQSNRVFALDWPRDQLHERIHQRVDAMFEMGLVEEVQLLVKKYGNLGRTARQAVGYREVLEFLAGSTDLNEAKNKVKTRTRQFSKRQGTWFRSLSECRFIPISGQVKPQKIVQQITGQSLP